MEGVRVVKMLNFFLWHLSCKFCGILSAGIASRGILSGIRNLHMILSQEYGREMYDGDMLGGGREHDEGF